VTAELLEEFALHPNSQILAKLPSHLKLFDILKSANDVEYVAGGSAQNTMRVAQWVLRKTHPNATTYMGCVADDKNAELMRDACEHAGVTCLYKVLPTTEDTPTGVCAVCITNDGHSRSLVALLGAAEKFEPSFLSSHWDEIANYGIFYNEGYFVTKVNKSILTIIYCLI
jgi:adenosine kinase